MVEGENTQFARRAVRVFMRARVQVVGEDGMAVSSHYYRHSTVRLSRSTLAMVSYDWQLRRWWR